MLFGGWKAPRLWFCSGACERTHADHRRDVQRQRRRCQRRAHTCETCDNPFLARAGARYCSTRCRMRAYRIRKEASAQRRPQLAASEAGRHVLALASAVGPELNTEGEAAD
jgi:hypothetical protein